MPAGRMRVYINESLLSFVLLVWYFEGYISFVDFLRQDFDVYARGISNFFSSTDFLFSVSVQQCAG